MTTAVGEKAALEAVGVVKCYGDRRVLRGVHLRVRPGEVHGLLGPNGAGKSTLMRVLLGLVRRDAGTVRLLGHELHSTAGPIPDHVAGSVDAPRFYSYLSGRQNLLLLARIDDTEATVGSEDRIRDALQQAGLAADADARVGGYSAGMIQRLGLAATLLRSPRLVLLDEPSSSLDPSGARDVRAHVRRMADEGVAVLLSSHDMSEVEDLCATLTILHEGRVVFSGSMAELRQGAPNAVHTLRTSDDDAALALASTHPRIEVARAADDECLVVSASEAALDRFVLALGAASIAVRRLEPRQRSLEALFLRLTADDDADSPPHARDGGGRDEHESEAVP